MNHHVSPTSNLSWSGRIPGIKHVLGGMIFQIAIIHPGLDHLKSDRKYKVRFVKRCTYSLPLCTDSVLFLTQKDQRDTPYTNLNIPGGERWNLEPWKRWRRYSPAHPAEHTLSPCSWQKLRWKHQMPNPQNSKVMIHGWYHHEFWGSKIETPKKKNELT